MSTRPDETKKSDDPSMQGEGNTTAARRYDQSQQAFVKSGKVEQAAQEARPHDAEEARELREAEQVGRSKARE